MFVKDSNAPARPPVQIPVPFLRRPVAAGDAVRAVTRAAGVKPCAACEWRRQALNQRIIFRPL